MSDIKELIASKLRPIGDAIREKDGSTELIPIDDMPQAIRNIQGGGGGIVEVSELPEVGKANTVYKLIHKNVGTVVPTTGLIEKIYFNTNLSVEEVNAILKTIEYIPATNEGEPDIYIVFETLDSIVRIFDYNNGSYAIMVGMNVAYVSDESFVSAGATFVGWNPDLTNPCVVYQESTPTDDFVSQNDKLTSLFSVTPFEEKIPSEMYYLYKENEWVQISGGILEVDKLPTSGEDNYVYALKKQPTYDVYVNEKEQGISNLTELAKQSGGKVEVVAVVNILPTENIIVSPSDSEMNLYYIKNDGLYVYADFTGDGNVTWHNFADAMVLSFSGEVTSESDMTVTDSLYLLSSGGDSANYYIYEKGEPTQVPNSGLIENLYFNTKLSIEETDAILSQLTYEEDGDPYIIGMYAKDSTLVMLAVLEANSYTQGLVTSGYIIGRLGSSFAESEIIYVSNQELVDLALTEGLTSTVGWNKESIIVNNELNQSDGSQNDKLINVVSTTPYPRWTKISGGGATVKATPEVVPNTGYVERVYFNKSLSFDEVNAICTKANNLVANETLKVNCILNTKDNSKVLTVMKFTNTDDSTFNVILYPDWLTVIWSEKDYTSSDGTMTFKKSWNIEQDYLEINAEVVAVSEDDIPTPCGTYNDQLTELFSINNVFKTEEIQLSEEYDGSPLVLSNKYVKKTVVPNEGYVERVYFNTSLSIDEVKAIIEKFYTYFDVDTLNNAIWLINIDDFNSSGVTPEKLYWIMPSSDTGDYAIVNALAQVIFKSDSSKWTGGNFVGWNPEFITAEKPYLEINSQVFPIVTENGKEIKVGGFNDKLVDLFSLTPFEEKIYDSVEVDVKSLLEEKKLPLEIKVNVESESANVVKGGGTVVPNSGYVENIYFNTSLSVEEVVSILSQLTYTDGQNPILINSSMTIALNIFNATEGMVIQNMVDDTIYFSSTIEASNGFGADFVGWNTNITYPININDEVISNADGMNVGTENDKLTNLISITPFESKVIKELSGDYKVVDIVVTENKTVDVETYLDNKQMPISVKVNVPKVNVLELQYTPLVFGAVSSKIHFNTNLTTEEVDAILNNENLDYYVDYEDANTAVYLIQFGETAESYYKLMLITKNYNKITKKTTFSINYGTTGGNTSIYNSTDGWLNSDYIPAVTINAFASGDNSESTANKNFKLLELLFSSSPYNYEETKVLEGDYEAVDLEFNELPSVWKGTQVPNSGYVQDMYFNIKLSVDEVNNILDSLDYTNNIYGIALVKESENAYLPLYVERGEKYGLSGYAIRYTASLFIFVSNQEIVDFISANLGVTTKIGWNIENSLLNVYRDVVPSYQDNTYGTQNDKLTSLISIEPPLENTIDLEPYLDKKQMPLSVKVNVESQEPNLQEKEITENGEYVADEGYDGFSKVTVNVGGSSEDRLKKLLDATQSTSYLFDSFQGKSVDDLISYEDTENVTKMQNMFMNCKALTEIPPLDTSKVTNMDYMFYNCLVLTEIPPLDTSNVTGMKQMFYQCESLTEIPQLDTSNVTNMNAMFNNCKALTTIPQIDTSKVTNMGYMFNNCYKLTAVSQLDTSKVTNVQFMFNGCSALTAIPQLDTSKVTSMNDMFNGCSALTAIPQINMIKVKSDSYASNMLLNCRALTNLLLLNIKVNLQLGSGDGTGVWDWGHLLTLESLINTIKECINVGSAKTLTMGTTNLNKIASTYVKFTDSSVTSIPKNEKGDVVVCESTDTGAMLLSDYALLKNWTLA